MPSFAEEHPSRLQLVHMMLLVNAYW